MCLLESDLLLHTTFHTTDQKLDELRGDQESNGAEAEAEAEGGGAAAGGGAAEGDGGDVPAAEGEGSKEKTP